MKEVWFWEDDRLLIYVKKGRGYVRRSKSSVLPKLDIQLFTSFVSDTDQPRALRAFLAALRRH